MYYENNTGKVYYEVYGPKEAPVIFFPMGLI